MKLGGMADQFRKQADDPNIGLETADERIAELIEAEWDLRYNKKLNRFLKKASLRYPAASFDQALYDPERKLDTQSIERLSSCEWIDQRKNLIITGKSSTGKTFIANALAVCAIREFKATRYIKTEYLMNEMRSADVKDALMDVLNKFTSYELLVIDDFGLMNLDPNMCRYLFEVMDSREGKGSTLVVSQLPVSSWYDLFKDDTYADACMERLIRNAYRLEFTGKNMREAQNIRNL